MNDIKSKLPSTLIKFLNEKNCYNEFERNLISRIKKSEKDWFNHYLQQIIINPMQCINGAFDWSTTPQNYNFWSQLHREYPYYYTTNSFQTTNNLTNQL